MSSNSPVEVTISMATSVDGYISTLDGDSDWVLDDDLFDQTVAKYGCIVVGHGTYDQYEGELYPMAGVDNIVLTHVAKDSESKNVHFVTSVDKAIAKAQELGFNKLLVIGGAKTNQSFVEAGQVHKVFVDVHPLALGEGKSLLGDAKQKLQLHLLKSKVYDEGFVHLEYEVKRG